MRFSRHFSRALAVYACGDALIMLRALNERNRAKLPENLIAKMQIGAMIARMCGLIMLCGSLCLY